MTHTAKVFEQQKQLVDQLLTKARITRDQWSEILFETGMAYLEAIVPAEEVLEYATNPSIGFWNRWYQDFIEDDAILLNLYRARQLTPEMYKYDKQIWIESFKNSSYA